MDGESFDDYLFVVIPGIGGSVLERVHGQRRQLVWSGVGQAAARVVDPSTLAIDDDDGIRAIGTITDWQLGPLTVVQGYAGLVRTIANLAPASRIDWGHPDERDLGARVVVFPFDFRRGVIPAAVQLHDELTARLEHLGRATDDTIRRVIVVAHSMGGLVARYWAGPLGGSSVCKAIVTLGTPHRGAPKALSFLHEGMRLGPLPIARRLSRVVQSWPGLYDLLPRYQVVETAAGRCYPKDLGLPWIDAAKAAAAFEMHSDIEDVWGGLCDVQAPAVLPVIGVGCSTLEAASLGADATLELGRVSPAWIGGARWRGDGTVPRVSAIPLELAADSGIPAHRPAAGMKHAALPSWVGLADELRRLVTTQNTSHVRGEGLFELVIDVEEVWPSGLPQPCAVRALRVVDAANEPVLETEVAHVQFRIADDPWADAHRSGDEWVFDLPPSAPCALELQVRATTEDGDDPGAVTAAVRMVDAARLDEQLEYGGNHESAYGGER